MTMTAHEASRAALLELLGPVCARIASLDPSRRTSPADVRDLEVRLDEAFPAQGPLLSDLRQLVSRGVREGWLCDRGEPEARFSRVAKAGPATHGLSIDVVSLHGRAVEHSHPKGEVTIGFIAPDEVGARGAYEPAGNDGGTTFDGRPAGWVFLPPGSRHVPEVLGARMHLVYFLPDGAVEWHLDGAAPASESRAGAPA